MEVEGSRRVPREACPESLDCFESPRETASICYLDGRCGTCGRYAVKERDEEAGLLGLCRAGVRKGLLPCDDEGCSRYRLRTENDDIDLEGVPDMDREELKELIREAIEEEMGVSEIEMGSRWEGGELVIKPANPDLKPKVLPLDGFFHKIVMIRDRLRVLEQKINSNPRLSDREKVDLQQYISRIYGSLTTFNVLFKDKADQFVGEK